MEMKNKNIIVTGATSGIGKSLTKALLNAGAHVAFCGRSEDKMSKLLLELENIKGNSYHETFDIINSNDIVQFVRKSISKIGQIDILVNCAGANSARSPVPQIEVSDLEWMLKVNLIAPFVFMKEVYNNSMLNRKKGMIINVLSTVCSFSNEGIGSYTASKAGFDSLVKVFRKEARGNNIQVCSIYPGSVDTPFRDNSNPDYLRTDTVVNAVISMMKYDENTSVDELVIRPMIEKNFC